MTAIKVSKVFNWRGYFTQISGAVLYLVILFLRNGSCGSLARYGSVQERIIE
jgi:hypothetical protein